MTELVGHFLMFTIIAVAFLVLLCSLLCGRRL